MKKMVALLMLVVLMVCCGGCAYSEEAPTLYIILGDQVIEAQGGVSAYEKLNLLTSNSEMMLATLVSPSDRKYKPICTEATVAYFEFDEQPKSMSLKYYKGEDEGNDSNTVESTMIQPNGDEWPLQAGGNIYELTVSWENAVSSRTARYDFYIVVQ